MKIRIVKTLSDNKYTMTIYTETDQGIDEKILKFGEPEINVGGSFTGPPAFILPNLLRKIIKGFPYSAYLDKDTDVNAETKIDIMADEIKQRIIEAVNILRSQADNFTDEILITV